MFEEGWKDRSLCASLPNILYRATRSPVWSLGLGLARPFIHAWEGVMRLNLGLPDVFFLKCTSASTVLRKALETIDQGLGGILGLPDYWV